MGRTGSGRAEIARLFDEHAVRAFRYARAVGLPHADADDVVAESFLRVLQSASAFRGDATFATWLFRIVRNQVLDFFRSESRRRNRYEAAAGQAATSVPGGPDRIAERKETHAAVAEALAALDSEERESLSLVTAGGLTYREAAEVEEITPSALASRVFRARRVLRDRLVEKGILPSAPDRRRFRSAGEA